MAFTVETFFEEDGEVMERTNEGGSQIRGTGETPKLARVRKEREQESLGGPLLNRLMMGDLIAVGEMGEDGNKDLDLVQEVVATMRALRERTLMVRSDEELKHDTETLVGAKKKMNVLKENAQNRDKMREAGMALQLFRTMIKTKDGKKSALFKTMNGKEDGGRSEETD